MPRTKRLPYEVADRLDEVTAYLLSKDRPMRHAIGLANTIREHGATIERLNLLFDALEKAASEDEGALQELYQLRRYGEK